MPLKEGEKVAMKFPHTEDVLEGVVDTVKVVGNTVKYIIECTTNGVFYIVEEIRGDNDTLN